MGEPVSDSQFEVLMRVQDLDTVISQLTHRKTVLEERLELQAVEAQLITVAARDAVAKKELAALAVRLDELEEQVSTVNERRTGLEGRMYADRGGAARDLQAMDVEVHHLAERRAEIEEAELEIMMEQDPIEGELAQLAQEKAALEEVALGHRVALKAAETVIDAELSAAQMSRAAEATQLPADLAEKYETLRTHLKGVGAARLIGNRCDGCHLQMSPVEVERIMKMPDDAIVTCEQCARILVRTPPPAA
jgi:uncharacterized protein